MDKTSQNMGCDSNQEERNLRKPIKIVTKLKLKSLDWQKQNNNNINNVENSKDDDKDIDYVYNDNIEYNNNGDNAILF